MSSASSSVSLTAVQASLARAEQIIDPLATAIVQHAELFPYPLHERLNISWPAFLRNSALHLSENLKPIRSVLRRHPPTLINLTRAGAFKFAGNTIRADYESAQEKVVAAHTPVYELSQLCFAYLFPTSRHSEDDYANGVRKIDIITVREFYLRTDGFGLGIPQVVSFARREWGEAELRLLRAGMSEEVLEKLERSPSLRADVANLGNKFGD